MSFWCYSILLLFLIVSLLLLPASSVARAENGERSRSLSLADSVSGAVLPMCIGLTAYHVARSDPEQRETGVRMADAIVLSTLATGVGKIVISASRPHPDDPRPEGMPSGHTSLSFATAAALSERKPGLRVPAYGTAVLVGWSRHRTRAHSWDQIAVGAALGAYVGYRAGRGEWSVWGGRNNEGLTLSVGEGVLGKADQLPELQLEYRTSF